MAMTRTELDAALDRLAAWVPQMLAETTSESQMDAYAGEFEVIEQQTAAEDRDHLHARSQCILGDAGLIPSDELPCSE